MLQAVSGRADFTTRLQVGASSQHCHCPSCLSCLLRAFSPACLPAAADTDAVVVGLPGPPACFHTRPPTLGSSSNLAGCCCCALTPLSWFLPPSPAPQAHLTFECTDVEAHKDACAIIQLGINNNLSGEQAPKVRGRGEGGCRTAWQRWAGTWLGGDAAAAPVCKHHHPVPHCDSATVPCPTAPNRTQLPLAP